MFLAILRLYGMGAKASPRCSGTAVSLLLIAGMAEVFVHAAYITGTAAEEATLVQSLGGGRVSLQGLVIAGMLIGALGVLNDVTVSQATPSTARRSRARSSPRWSAPSA